MHVGLSLAHCVDDALTCGNASRAADGAHHVLEPDALDSLLGTASGREEAAVGGGGKSVPTYFMELREVNPGKKNGTD